MSARRKKRVPKTGAVWRLSTEEATLAKKPKYNGYACGHGAHGSAKFNRTKSNRAWKAQLRQEGVQKGPFFFIWRHVSRCLGPSSSKVKFARLPQSRVDA